jgi:hypothetical protein
MQMLDAQIQHLWDSYLAAERDRIRAVTMPALALRAAISSA